jgi:hypothetical protein
MKYKYFTWIQDVLQELLCLSSIQKKKSRKHRQEKSIWFFKKITGNREWYNEMRCRRDCYSNSTERRTVQEKTIMEGNQNLCLIFCCVLGTIMFPRGPCCCGNFAKDLEEEK